MKLTLATYGFFVLPMRGRRCVGLVAPANAVELGAHRAELLIDGVVTSSTVPGLAAGRHRTTTIPLTGCRLRFGKPEPAAVANFDLILNVSDLFDEGVLKPTYATGGHANVVVDFSGGSVAAAADRHTGSQVWTFEEASEVKRLTSLITYTRSTWSGRLTLHKLGGTADSQTYVQFSRKGATLALRYVPAAADSSFAQVNHHHAESTKPLLVRMPNVSKSFHSDPTPTTDVPRAVLSAHVASFLGMDPDGETWRRAPEAEGTGDIEVPPPPPQPFEGDPHCSMRKAQVARRPLPEHIDELPPVTAR